ncbi:MAG TPA: hypothetical protein VLZ11_08180 [Flavobacterium sp.]|nr:hypothetical protein [Flavobacterium sp.]
MKNLLFILLLFSIIPCKETLQLLNHNLGITAKQTENTVGKFTLENNLLELPLNSKVTVKLIKTDDLNFEISVLKIEPLKKKLKSHGGILFKKTGEEETLEIYFGETTNTTFMFIMKSRSAYSLNFKTEIQSEEGAVYKEIINMGVHKGTASTEVWAQKTYKIRFSEFKLRE